MNVAIITNFVSKKSGQGRVNYEVAKAACRKGHYVFLLSRDVAPELERRKNVDWIRIPVEKYPTRLVKDQFFAWFSTRWLCANASNVDVALANGCNTWSSAEFNAVHFVHSAWRDSAAHTARERSGPYAWYKWLYTTLNSFLEQWVLNKAGTVIAVSERVRDELSSIGIPACSIEVIQNGVDIDEFRPGSSDRKALGLPRNVPLALFVGEIETSRKNLDTVLQALDRIPDLHLAVVGSKDKSPYPRMTCKLGISDRVHFLGYRTDVPDLMRAADLFVFPSRYEACSLVLLEAMASGLPIITTQTAGGAELVKDSFGKTLPDPNDEYALAEALASLTENPSLLEQMGYEARSAAKEHTWRSVSKQYLDLFEKSASK